MSARKAINLGTKMIFSGIMIGLCAFHLASDRTQEYQKLYLCGLAANLAYLLPSPTISTDETLM
ncbi:MAG: hypothetical protein QNJ63_05800 [Calothrix sp. MO_192.B10]|nr:hypothetical protein [Calothrix sp. MO_192.B10]